MWLQAFHFHQPKIQSLTGGLEQARFNTEQPNVADV